MMYQILEAIERLKASVFLDKGPSMCWIYDLPEEGQEVAICSYPEDREVIHLEEDIPLKELDKVLREHGFTKFAYGISTRVYLNDAMDKAIRVEFFDGMVYRITLTPCKVLK